MPNNAYVQARRLAHSPVRSRLALLAIVLPVLASIGCGERQPSRTVEESAPRTEGLAESAETAPAPEVAQPDELSNELTIAPEEVMAPWTGKAWGQRVTARL